MFHVTNTSGEKNITSTLYLGMNCAINRKQKNPFIKGDFSTCTSTHPQSAAETALKALL